MVYATGSSTLSISSVAPSSGYEVKVWNTTDVPLVPDSIVTAYWNTQVKGWVVASKPETFGGNTNGTITAAGALSLGSGTVDLYYINSSGQWVTTGGSVTAYNLTTSAISAGKKVTIKRFSLSDKWVIDMEECP